ncbi:MAG: hypothetical protein Q8N89_00925 [Azonexus sp.]|nr:hypothetical protein [Azonexus sp.]
MLDAAMETTPGQAPDGYSQSMVEAWLSHNGLADRLTPIKQETAGIVLEFEDDKKTRDQNRRADIHPK